MNTQNNCESGRLVLGLILIVLGALFFAGELTGVRLGQFTWPLLIVVAGLAFFVGMVLGGKSTGPLAIPGSIITTIGLILFYQNTTNHWESWAYAWALIVSAVGVGMVITGQRSDRPAMRRAGQRTITLGLVMFLIGLVFFELVIGISGRVGGQLRSFAGPVALILLGLLLILGRRMGRGVRLPSALDRPAEPDDGPEATEGE